MFNLRALNPPLRRVLAVDAGARRIKLLLVESEFGRLRISRQELIDLASEGLVSPEETKAHLGEVLADWGDPPVALALPQHVVSSQVIDLPNAPDDEVERLIGAETLKLAGVSESRIVFDFVPTEARGTQRQQFWVTVAQESEIRERIAQLALENEDICDVTTTANALVAAYRNADPLASRAILVHQGAQSTIVVVMLAGQGVFAATFEMGGDFFTRALARQLDLEADKAEQIRRTHNLFEGEHASPEYQSLTDGWADELKRQLEEWLKQNPGAEAARDSFKWIISGGNFLQPGLVDYVRRTAGLPLESWPAPTQPEAIAPPPGFEVACGVALQALGYSAQPVSLLPDDYRTEWNRRVQRQRLDLGSAILAGLCLLALLIVTWSKISLVNRKAALLAKVRAGQATYEANQTIGEDLALSYEALRPVFLAQQTTLDTLQTLSVLQQARTNQNMWFVVLADQQSYFEAPPLPTPTNRPPRLGPFLGPEAPGSTNVSPAKPGFIAELCIMEEPETARRSLRELVSQMERATVFSKVDLLSDDLRRSLAEPKVVIPDRQFVLALDFARSELTQPFKRPARETPSPPRAPPRRAALLRHNQDLLSEFHP